jgi:thiol:disulfide interchange protein DsbD
MLKVWKCGALPVHLGVSVLRGLACACVRPRFGFGRFALILGLALAIAHQPLAVAEESSGSRSAVSKWLESLGVTGSDDAAGANRFLPAEEAFVFAAEVIDGRRLAVRWRIADGYYLYRDKLSFVVDGDGSVAIAEVALPSGEPKEDEFFGRMEVYHHDIEAIVTVSREVSSAAPVTLQARYQGCAEDGYCYPPMTRRVELLLPEIAVRK